MATFDAAKEMVTGLRSLIKNLCLVAHLVQAFRSVAGPDKCTRHHRPTFLVVTESAWSGAGVPRDDLDPADLPTLLMNALTQNNSPHVDAGLCSMWAFAGDTTRHIFQHNLTDYLQSAHETANAFPTSFYGNAFYGKSWKMITSLNRVGGDNGWIATQVMETVSCDGRLRRWQWELRKNRRPPNLNCWFVESIGSSDRKGQFEPE